MQLFIGEPELGKKIWDDMSNEFVKKIYGHIGYDRENERYILSFGIRELKQVAKLIEKYK